MRARSPSITCCRSPPSILKRVPQMLMDRSGPCSPCTAQPALAAALDGAFRRAACSPAEVQKGIDSFALLMAEANIAWKAEIQASGLGQLFRTKGALYVYESEGAFASDAEERALQRAKGIVFEVVDGTAPASWRRASTILVVRGVHYWDGMHTINPYKVVARTLAERFAADGAHHPAQPGARLRPQRRRRRCNRVDVGRDRRSAAFRPVQW